MDHSLVTASSATHVKIVAVALLGAILVVIVGIVGHAAQPLISGHGSGMVVKAGNPATYSSHDRSTVR